MFCTFIFLNDGLFYIFLQIAHILYFCIMVRAIEAVPGCRGSCRWLLWIVKSCWWIQLHWYCCLYDRKGQQPRESIARRWQDHSAW